MTETTEDRASTLTLADFLLARIAEDRERGEFGAQQIAGSPWPDSPHWEPWRLTWHDELYDLLCVEPSRVLAECEAKRQIVIAARRYSPELEHGDNGEWAFDVVLRCLALPYADHPDYRQEWRP